MNKLLIIVIALCVAIFAGTALLRNNIAQKAETVQPQVQQDTSELGVVVVPEYQGKYDADAPTASPGKPNKGSENPCDTVFYLPSATDPINHTGMVRTEADRPHAEPAVRDQKPKMSASSPDQLIRLPDASETAKADGRTEGVVSQKDGEDEIVTLHVKSGTGNMPDREIKVRVRKWDGKTKLPESATEPLKDPAPAAGKKDVSKTKPKDAAQTNPLPQIGSPVTIGSYPQNGLMGRQPLRWRVLDIFGADTLLVVTETVIDCMPFHKDFTGKPGEIWKDSDIRKWLNGDFFDKTFTAKEKHNIFTTSIECGPYSNGAVGRYHTEDKVFLLSSEEAEKYFKNNADRMCVPARQAVKHGIFTDKDGGRCLWWLRSSAKADATIVDFGGYVHFEGEPTNLTKYGVRPAMVIRYPN